MEKETGDKYEEDRGLFLKALEEAICARFDRIVKKAAEAEEDGSPQDETK